MYLLITAMIDFMPPSTRTVTFSPLEQMQLVTVNILPDDITEGTGEFFLVELTPMTNPVQVTVGQSLATVTITETAGK